MGDFKKTDEKRREREAITNQKRADDTRRRNWVLLLTNIVLFLALISLLVR
jgi:hypothetical protein